MERFGIVAVLGVLLACEGNRDDSATGIEKPAAVEQEPMDPVKTWYQGGTLHGVSALEWQGASYENKLATCADFVAKLSTGTSLKPGVAAKMSTIEGIKPFAEALVKQLDDAMKKRDDVELNRKIYTNQTVASNVAMVIVLMGWTE